MECPLPRTGLMAPVTFGLAANDAKRRTSDDRIEQISGPAGGDISAEFGAELVERLVCLHYNIESLCTSAHLDPIVSRFAKKTANPLNTQT